MDVREHNRMAWDRCVDEGDRWTQPVDSNAIERARRGDFEIVLTPTRAVPKSWFPKLQGANVLCLASAGGQQAPILAAAGAEVTVLDNSPKQLGQDRLVAQREGLEIRLEEGDMADLGRFDNESFSMIFHPCSNTFASEIRPVWKESARVLQSGGCLLSGFVNPVRFLFDDERAENGSLEVCHSIPFSDVKDLPSEALQPMIDAGWPLVFGHTLEDQIGGQLDAGLVVNGFYEDRRGPEDPLSQFLATYIATRSVKGTV